MACWNKKLKDNVVACKSCKNATHCFCDLNCASSWFS